MNDGESLTESDALAEELRSGAASGNTVDADQGGGAESLPRTVESSKDIAHLNGTMETTSKDSNAFEPSKSGKTARDILRLRGSAPSGGGGLQESDGVHTTPPKRPKSNISRKGSRDDMGLVSGANGDGAAKVLPRSLSMRARPRHRSLNLKESAALSSGSMFSQKVEHGEGSAERKRSKGIDLLRSSQDDPSFVSEPSAGSARGSPSDHEDDDMGRTHGSVIVANDDGKRATKKNAVQRRASSSLEHDLVRIHSWVNINRGEELKRANRRREIVRELVNTEEQYVSDLRLVVELFMDPMEERNLIDREERISIFSNIRTLLPLNQALLEGFKQSNDKEAYETIGEVFMQHEDQLKQQYAVYCSTHTSVRERLKALKERKKEVREYIAKCYRNPECRRIDLESFLIMPMQRLCKYPLLLEELADCTPPHHAGIKTLNRATETIREIVARVNERTRLVEDISKLLELEAKLTEAGSFNLVERGRQYILESQISLSNTDEINYAFLFSDVLLLCDYDEEDDLYELVRVVNVSDILLPEGGGSRNAPMFKAAEIGQVMMEITCNTVAIRNRWVKELQRLSSLPAVSTAPFEKERTFTPVLKKKSKRPKSLGPNQLKGFRSKLAKATELFESEANEEVGPPKSPNERGRSLTSRVGTHVRGFFSSEKDVRNAITQPGEPSEIDLLRQQLEEERERRVDAERMAEEEHRLVMELRLEVTQLRTRVQELEIELKGPEAAACSGDIDSDAQSSPTTSPSAATTIQPATAGSEKGGGEGVVSGILKRVRSFRSSDQVRRDRRTDKRESTDTESGNGGVDSEQGDASRNPLSKSAPPKSMLAEGDVDGADGDQLAREASGDGPPKPEKAKSMFSYRNLFRLSKVEKDDGEKRKRRRSFIGKSGGKKKMKARSKTSGDLIALKVNEDSEEPKAKKKKRRKRDKRITVDDGEEDCAKPIDDDEGSVESPHHASPDEMDPVESDDDEEVAHSLVKFSLPGE